MKKRLSNGCFIETVEIYNGFIMTYRYGVFTFDHLIYCTCETYKQAFEIASNLA